MKKKLLVFAALLVLLLVCVCAASAEPVEGAPEKVINWGDLYQITMIGDHPVTNPQVTVEPTCTTPGKAYFECTAETHTTHYHWVAIYPLEHDWASESGDLEWGNIIEDPTCMKDGRAQDVCLRCGATRDVYRPISKYPHVFEDFDDYTTYNWVPYKDSTCVVPGKGWKVCVYGCGTKMPEDPIGETHLVTLPLIPHDWSDWREDIPTTCAKLGKASRTCIACGATQSVYEGHDVLDQGVTITIGEILPYPNPDWDDATADLDGADLESQAELDAILAYLDLVDVKYELVDNWLADCYTRKLTYSCPFCKKDDPHADFTVSIPTIAHIWKDAPEAAGEPGVEEAGKSLAPTCEKDGYDLYLCKYDEDHGHDKEDQYMKVPVPALGHDWSEWYPAEQFQKDGKTYTVYFRYCQREFCGLVDQKTELGSPEVKEGLVKDSDGVWRYYIDGEVATEVTKLVPFQGGEFWVVNGVVPAGANGLIVCPDGKAYFLAQGQIQRVTQWAEYNGEWFIIKNGELDKVTGLMPYDGSRFAVESGRKLHVNGLWQDPNSGVWVYLADGQLQDYTGEVTYDGATFNVVHGYLVV